MKVVIAGGAGGDFHAVNLEHVSRAFYHPGEGGEPSRLSIAIGGAERELVLTGEDADRVWKMIEAEGVSSPWQ
jgi:hypothetical protein